jgi:hypothetical protein
VKFPLADLQGCQIGHSCPKVDRANPKADRYCYGYYVMDPGENMTQSALYGFAPGSADGVRTEKLPNWDFGAFGRVQDLLGPASRQASEEAHPCQSL